MNMPAAYEKYLGFFENALTEYCGKMNFSPSVLTESMRYSLQSGGKRLRPVLFFAMLDACGYDYTREAGLAVALECIHTYSLIHDDLPAMDNDDFRRGRPSNHKAFGEANAILAGDGLLSYAFDLILKEAARGGNHLRAGKVLSEAAGVDGMISGQSYDLSYTGKALGIDDLFTVYRLKTGAMIAAGLVMAGVLAEKNEEIAREYGQNLGILFQLTDDLIDEYGDKSEVGKTTGKDKKADKLTCIKVLGGDGAKALADEYVEKCLASLQNFDGDARFFRELAVFVRSRTK